MPRYRYTPWYTASLAYVTASVPTTARSSYQGTDTTVAAAADGPSITPQLRKDPQAKVFASATNDHTTLFWAFAEAIALCDATAVAAAGPPGEGGEDHPPPADFLAIEHESPAGVFTGQARVSVVAQATAEGDEPAPPPTVYTGWYGNTLRYQLRNAASWVLVTDTFGNPNTVAFPAGWQSAAALAGMPLLDSAEVDVDTGGAGSVSLAGLTAVDLADARFAVALNLDAQVTHTDIGTPTLFNPAYSRTLTVVASAINVGLQYQPPRYRYVLPGRPLRQFPRDDTFGGVPRQGKASRSVQASPRQGWAGAYR